jgi:hypothetical protein
LDRTSNANFDKLDIVPNEKTADLTILVRVAEVTV